MRAAEDQFFGRSCNFMKANGKISLVISKRKLDSFGAFTPLLFLLFNCGFEIANLRFFTVHQILSQILHFGGHGLYRSGSALKSRYFKNRS